MTKLGYAALSEDKFLQLEKAVSNMSSNYATVKVCDYKDSTKCDLSLEPELDDIIANSRDPEELKYYWVQWYNKAGAPTRDDFQTYVDLTREAAILNSE
jgi:peptidyl-dipeptidase A